MRMSRLDEGWIFLNSNSVEDFLEDEKDYKFIYSNGNGDYIEKAGSFGYKDSDGSASYRGADGSYGYKNSDGSVTYHGVNGCWGYRNSDGSGEYHGLNEYTKFYDKTEYDDEYDGEHDDEHNEDDRDEKDLNILNSIILIGTVFTTLLSAKYVSQVMEEKKIEEENKRIQKEKEDKREIERELRKKRLKALFFHRKKIEFNFSTSELIDENVEIVQSFFKTNGFTNVRIEPIKDVYVDNSAILNKVQIIKIDGKNFIKAEEKIPYDAEIVILFHAKKEFKILHSNHYYHNIFYMEVYHELITNGCSNVKLVPMCDLVNGWIKKENTVESVLINGNSHYKRGQYFQHDTKIEINYHSFKKNTRKEE